MPPYYPPPSIRFYQNNSITALCRSGRSDGPDGSDDVFLDVLAAVHERFDVFYRRWESSGFDVIRVRLRPWIGIFGKPVQIQIGSKHLEGVACDIDESGALVVRMDSGLMQTVRMGEVTLLR